MAFPSIPFLLGFLPLTLSCFALAARCNQTAPRIVFILASLVFYTVAAAAYLPVLLLSIAGNYLLLHRIARRNWLVIGVAANLALLIGFKSAGVPPLGLSFFTFTQIGCLLHYASGADKPPRALDYLLFVAFFPTLIAGPILNAAEMLPQFANTRTWRLTPDNLAVGFGFFILGLCQKTILADPLGAVVDPAFADPSALTVLPAWQAACGYSLQLYFDFAGYTDMAIGLGWMFGLRLPDNFDRPYRAVSVIAYWQRWHMSLTRFLMANVHTPLTLAVMRWRKRHGRPINNAAQRRPIGFLTMIALPVAVTMALVSLWHGAAATFLAFGALHIGFLLVNHAWRLWRAPRLPATASVALTYLCVLVASVFFRAPGLTQATKLIAAMAGRNGIAPFGSAAWAIPTWLAALYAIVWFAPSVRRIMQPDADGTLRWRPSPGWAVAMGSGAMIGVLAAGGTTEFLYVRF